jgi:CRP/FNR family transcriptional regulator, cyclic AMP receptor protein
VRSLLTTIGRRRRAVVRVRDVANVAFVTQTVPVEWTLLEGLPPENIRRLLAIARRRTFRKGEVVFHRDDLAESLHLIVKGRFAVRITTQLGETALLDVIGPGEAFGELALLSPGSRRSATVESLDDGETLSVYRDDFALLQSEHPGVKDVLLRLLAEQLARASDRIVEAHYTDAETRVRRRLRDLAVRQGQPAVSMTQEHLAEMAGTSRATVNRVLREEERRGTVALSRGCTTVIDLEELSRRC